MIVIEIYALGNVTLNNGNVIITGEKQEELKQFVQDAIDFAGCSTEDEDHELNVARLIIEEIGGFIVKHEKITVIDEKHNNNVNENKSDLSYIENTIKSEADFNFFDDVIKNL